MGLYNRRRSMLNCPLVCILGILFLLAPLLSSCTTSTTPTQAIHFVPLNLGIPADAMKSPVVGPLPDNTILHVRITFKMNPNWLKRMEQQKIQPGQRSRLESFANQLGISDATYQKFRSFFNAQGLALSLSKLRTLLAIDGKASTFARLLRVKFVIHNYNGRKFFAPNAPPNVPQILANSIDAVTGLDNYSVQPTHDLTMHFNAPSTPGQRQQDCSPMEQTLLPRDVAGAYGHSQLWQQGLNGENMTVNLVEIDGSYRDDIQNYLDCINFKGNLQFINVDGHPSDALGESTLDIQMVAGLARSVNIKVYQTDGSNDSGDIWAQVNDMLQQILNDNTGSANSGNVVSVSLGAAEGEMTSDDATAIDSSLQQLTRIEHMTVFIASGDCGAFTDQRYGDLSVSFPASDPWATSVGGTILQVNGNRNRVAEAVWSDDSNRSRCKNSWGSGGGNSTFFKQPSWQNAVGVRNRYSRGVRQLPDVSAAAYGLAVYFNGQWGAVGGTSAAAPIWAAGLALVNEGLLKQGHAFGYGPQLFYQVANAGNGARSYYDVTRGNNLYYPATPGWDFATGLGTPNFTDFYQAMSNLER
jgi:kumamolisin